MGLTFKDEELVIGGTEWAYAPFRFSKILKIGSGVMPTWQDIIVSGTNSLTLPNAKADGLNYLKLYGGCEKDFTPISMNYETVYNMQHSTFDISKFTVVGSPTITTDGIASGFNNSNYITKTISLSSSDNIEFNFGFVARVGNTGGNIDQALFAFDTGTPFSGSTRLLAFTLDATGTAFHIWQYSGSATKIFDKSSLFTVGNSYQGKITWDGTTFKLYIDSNYIDEVTPTNPVDFGTIMTIGNWVGGYQYCYSDINLKQFSITVNGVPVFSGNQTGIDTYTINGSTVSIPYTLSSTGDKIVDSIYLTSVQSVIENLDTSTYIVINNSNETATDYRARILCNNGILKVNIQGEIYADGTAEAVKDSLNNTATAENLFAVGTTEDVQDVLTGIVTRNCEAVYYDGTQTINTPYISTTGGLDVGAIIVHPRTIPTTETVTPQMLTVQAGTNTIEITQSSIDDLPLEVSYKAGVTVTITEIENANVDNSVTVVIS